MAGHNKMQIYVQGLWHLGIVTAACLASVGHNVVGFDDDDIINKLNNGESIIFEPGLQELINKGFESKNLKFSSDVHNINFLWVAYDTPVDDNDNVDVNFIFSKIKNSLPLLSNEAMILISSQMPVGSVKSLEKLTKELYPEKNITFAYSPENLRLGSALNIFLNPDRIIVGIRSEGDKIKIKALLDPITDKIEWMSIESAEMTKHAINAFLATSVVFANEIASICEMAGADAKEVERGLKSEQRIGYKAYLSPGAAFSGGTLARDIEFLKTVSKTYELQIPLLESVKVSNNNHKSWMQRKIQKLFPDLKNIPITIWGITYKSGTDTLRRSLWVELCNWLIDKGANVKIYDPIVKKFPEEWGEHIQRFSDPIESLIDTKILLIGTEYKEYKDIFKNNNINNLTVIDSNRLLSFLEKSININYISVGTPHKYK
jgi:UDPglucose 6-dehydrogenase